MSEPRNLQVYPEIDLVSGPIDVDLENAKREWISVDLTAFKKQMAGDDFDRSAGFEPDEKHQNIVSPTPVILPEASLTRVTEAISSIYDVIQHPGYYDYVMKGAPEIARRGNNVLGVLMGFDFHITPDGPKLIEINTNAGGALVNAGLLLSQKTCCAVIDDAIRNNNISQTVTDRILASFLAEWQAFGGKGKPARIAIVDEEPEKQYLYPELLLFRALFKFHGIDAEIAASEQLSVENGALFYQGKTVDIVYNRVTDFYFENPQNQALRQAYQSGNTLITSNPHHHALMAHKKNLVTLSSQDLLRNFGINEDTISVLKQVIPLSYLVTSENADEMWLKRRQLFFKPVSGYGSRGAYRGDKVTKRVWQTIIAGDYIAQEFVAPSLSPVKVAGVAQDMKVDIRAYVYNGEIQLLAARRYQGQTTNMRTTGGGFASVYANVS